MPTMPFTKYQPYKPVVMGTRKWPDKTIIQAPSWCSVDLRDGNQALETPMSLAQKTTFFQLLVRIGFKEIEVGFPSASQVEFDFTRHLIEHNLIPEDVTIQVLTQARQHLIEKTFAALQGVNKAVVHLYNSTSTLQRRVVFRKNRQETINLATTGAAWILQEAAKYPASRFSYEYSPESFTGTELEFARDICGAVLDVWQPNSSNRVILNLPATVEMSTPNIYADQIEWFISHLNNPQNTIISVHAHNDRGTAVAATELALLAGAERIEGTLFGNGERTGNVDIVTVALNLFSQGIDPQLDLTSLNEIVRISEACTGIPIHHRHPYAGKLVYTAFSGSHQDSINKGMKALCQQDSGKWEVPYLPIDPKDVGRDYESIIRINSQSGKGGIAYVLEHLGYALPKELHPEIGTIIQKLTDQEGTEIASSTILAVLRKEFIDLVHPYALQNFQILDRQLDSPEKMTSRTRIQATILAHGKTLEITGEGNGPLDGFCNALASAMGKFLLVSYHEHALAMGSSAQAVAYIQIEPEDGRRFFGIGQDTDITIASVKAVISALNRSITATL